MSFGIDALRQIIIDENIGWLPLKFEVLSLIFSSVFFLFLSFYFSKKIYEIARNKGKITGVED